MEKRETLGSRLGFILLSAGCAIGIGNVWRFPYITGKYGGGFFVLIYIVFLLILGIPIMTMEYSMGRASRRSILPAYRMLEKKGTKWHLMGYLSMAGNYVLLMFYSVVSGWILYYAFQMAAGRFEGKSTVEITAVYAHMISSPVILTGFMLIIVLITAVICSNGLQGSVEKVTKVMMIALILIMVVLGIRSLTLPGAGKGFSFYLKPSVSNIKKAGVWNVMYAALNQSFFTLSIGMGGMEIFGSYIDKTKRLAGEAVIVTCLDTFVAITAGLIIFPACFAYGISPDSGPSLIFLTLPRVFSSMALGRLWGTLFFIFPVLRGALYDDRRLREPSGICHRPAPHAAQKSRPDQRNHRRARLDPMRPWLQPLEQLPAAARGQHNHGHGRLLRQQHLPSGRLLRHHPLLYLEVRMGL